MKIDMHVHSHYSDGVLTIRQIIKQAKKRGLDGFAITDHDTIKGHKEIKKENDITIIPGLEITSEKGHILAYGIKEMIPKSLSVEETIELIHEQGGLAVAAHPLELRRKGVWDFWNYNFDATEINSLVKPEILNDKTIRKAREIRLSVIAGSDAHDTHMIGKATTIVAGETINEIIENIRKGIITTKIEKTTVNDVIKTLRTEGKHKHKEKGTAIDLGIKILRHAPKQVMTAAYYTTIPLFKIISNIKTRNI